MKISFLFAILLFIFLCGVVILWLVLKRSDIREVRDIEIGSHVLRVEVARTLFSRARGLSYRKTLHNESGMLFVFNSPNTYSFWMRGMNFPLDFIWIRNGRIIDITENVRPESFFFPRRVYSPKEPADMVLEVNAGRVRELGIGIEDTVQFKR